jgi:ubiquinone/menaquinone biosynthesis C-methylase UbiE
MVTKNGFPDKKNYEIWEESSAAYANKVEEYKNEIVRDAEIYQHFNMSGRVLDVGGGSGTVREFLGGDCEFVSVDPFDGIEKRTPLAKVEAYKCLQGGLNYVLASAEFLPFLNKSFDWVHMRSMLDHVQIPDLAILEAKRVLKDNGNILVGIKLETSIYGEEKFHLKIKEVVKDILGSFGFKKYKDDHIWHPTMMGLKNLLQGNGFVIKDIFWQTYYSGRVVYVHATHKK